MIKKNQLQIDTSMLLRAVELRAAGDAYYRAVGEHCVEEKLFSYYAAATAIEGAVKKRVQARRKARAAARERARRRKLGIPTKREAAIRRDPERVKGGAKYFGRRKPFMAHAVRAKRKR